MNRFNISTFPLANKTVFLRGDLDVPVTGNKVTDNQRLLKLIYTINVLLEENCKIILAGHRGRPEGKITASLSLKPVYQQLKQLMPGSKLVFLKDCIGREIKKIVDRAEAKSIFMLENLRFYREEEENDTAFAHSLASLADIYINDAFADSHRLHASIDKITAFIPSLAGITVETEIKQLSRALQPLRPVVWILGGAKLDKLKLLPDLIYSADYILLGGTLAFPFLKAKGWPVGMSKITLPAIRLAQSLLKKRHSHKIILPVDFKVAEKMSPVAPASTVASNEIKTSLVPLDIGENTIKLFKNYLKKARTIVWNGPLGYFEWSKYAHGTREIGSFIGKLTAISICGGGDTAYALRQLHLDQVMTHVSTGGGAALMFLQGQKLVGITALEKNYLHFKSKFRPVKI